MATTVIPERKIVTCDCCLRKVDAAAGISRRFNGVIQINKDALDFQGHAVGSDNIKLDLCDKCMGAICIAINETSRKLQREAK